MRFYQCCLAALLFVSSFVSANEYPTIETVRFVVDCMVKNGGQNEENLYACTCRYDVINAALTFAEFEQVSVYTRNKAMPGEKGGVIRDMKRATQQARDKYDQAEKEAARACPLVKRVLNPTISD